MKAEKIYDEDGRGFTWAFIGEDFEFADPVQHYKSEEIQKSTIISREMLKQADAFKAAFVPDQFFAKKAEAEWQHRYEKITSTPIPDAFVALLQSKSKGEQEKLLKGQSLTPDQLAALIFKAHSEFGYVLSSYYSERLPGNVNADDMPHLATVNNGAVTKIGETTLSDKQIKAAVNQRKVIVSKFLDHPDGSWHCFFQTYKSIRGEESWRDGQPHFHYLSDKWGIPRAQVVKQIKAGDYPGTQVHIPLLEYGGKKQPIVNESVAAKSSE